MIANKCYLKNILILWGKEKGKNLEAQSLRIISLISKQTVKQKK